LYLLQWERFRKRSHFFVQFVAYSC